MRLSEEIRLGSLLVQNPEKGNIRSCAIGMANLSAGFVVNNHNIGSGYTALRNRHVWLLADFSVQCPICPHMMWGEEIIWHPFDRHVMHNAWVNYNYVPAPEMTIDQLADFIRSIEPPDPSELLKEVDDAVGEHPEHQDVPMDIYERWERSAPERQG